MSNRTHDLNEIKNRVFHTHDFVSTAFHESGHIIYALLSLFKVDSAFLYFDKSSQRASGLTWYRAPLETLDKNADVNIVKSEICLKYAGLVAERYHFKKISGSDKFPLFLKDGSSEDTLSAAKLIKKHCLAAPGRLRYNYKKKLIAKTLKDLKNHWEEVTLVAHYLFKKKKISFFKLQELLTNQSNNKEFWKNQFYLIDQIFI